MSHHRRSMDPEPLGEFANRGAARALMDEVPDLWRSEAGLPVADSSTTDRGLVAAYGVAWQRRNTLWVPNIRPGWSGGMSVLVDESVAAG